MMRKRLEIGDKTFDFGVDRVTGVFIQSFVEDGPQYNWSEFYPFHYHFTVANIEAAIANNLLTEAEFKSICEVPIGYYKVYFTDCKFISNEKENDLSGATVHEKLVNHFVSEDESFEVKCLGDYYELLKLFGAELTFTEVTWLNLQTTTIWEMAN